MCSHSTLLLLLYLYVFEYMSLAAVSVYLWIYMYPPLKTSLSSSSSTSSFITPVWRLICFVLIGRGQLWWFHRRNAKELRWPRGKAKNNVEGGIDYFEKPKHAKGHMNSENVSWTLKHTYIHTHHTHVYTGSVINIYKTGKIWVNPAHLKRCRTVFFQVQSK